ECLTGEKVLEDYPELAQHAEWAKDIAARRTDLTKDNVDGILKEEIGLVFVHVLEDAGVYKCTDEGRAAFRRFIATL
ncbi:MAG: galactose-1-phosphate uridylyltransferase, partial [Clostridia bacterium]|nr:galactose-1-phosphate uridylyltransferase [Clostridia bacterium]